MITRGIRNNNPLNLRCSSSPWKGKVSHKGAPNATCCGGESGGTGRPNADGVGSQCDPVAEREFEQFISMEYGFRAAILTIETYILKHGCNTISSIVTRWAPASDGNNTDQYIHHVCHLTGIGGNEPLSNHDPRLKSIVAAMAQVECGEGIREYFSSLDRAFDNFTPKNVYVDTSPRRYK